jgi:hypothetical protein
MAGTLLRGNLGVPKDAPRAAALLQRSCDGGDAQACGRLAYELRTGDNLAKDPARQTDLLEQACALGLVNACREAAESLRPENPSRAAELEEGANNIERETQAHEEQACANGDSEACISASISGRTRTEGKEAGAAFLRQACEMGNGRGCEYLANRLAQPGRGEKPANPHEVSSLYEKACDLGDAAGCRHLAKMSAGVAQADAARTRALYQRACEAGDHEACADLGDMVARGEGGERDKAGALELYRQACGTNPPICVRAARRYLTGEGVPEDAAIASELGGLACEGHGDVQGCAFLAELSARPGPKQDLRKAVALYTRACDHGWTSSCEPLGDLYAKGQGVAADAKRAAALYERVCQVKDGFMPHFARSACASLADLFLEGRGVTRDLARAVQLDEAACRTEEPHACMTLGRLYREGRGVQADPDKGLELIVKACQGGEMRACETAWGALPASFRAPDVHRLRPRAEGVKPPRQIAATLKGLRSRLPGTVHLIFIVDEHGEVRDARATGGSEELRQSSVAVISGWRYEPGTKNGMPVKFLVVERFQTTGTGHRES